MQTVAPAKTTARPVVATAAGGGRVHGEALFQSGAMPGDDEQGVVDADAEADEHAEHGGEVGDGHDVAEQHDPGVGDADADQGGGDGQQGGGEGAEGEEEDDGGDGHPDEFGGVQRGRLGEGDGGAAHLDLEPVAVGSVRGVHHGLGLGGADVAGLRGEGDGGVGGAAVLADAAAGPGARLGVRPGDGGDAGQVRDAVQGVGHGLLDVGGAHGAVGGVPDDGVAVAREAGEAPFDEGGGLAGLGAAGRVVVGVRRSGQPRGGAGTTEDEQPEQDGQEAVVHAPAGECGHGRAPSGGVVLHRGAVGQGDARMGTAREKA